MLSALVVAHEWGHFIVARIFKIRVDDFSVGFGKRLIRLGKLGDTEYNIRAIPLGGFVKIAGMEPDEEPINRAKDLVKGQKDSDPDAKEIPLLAENMEDPGIYNGPDGFNSKPLWQRSLVILGGPVMSFITGVVILCLLGCTFGIPNGKAINRVLEVQPGGEGQRIGLHAGDYIVALNGVPVTTGDEMVRTIHKSLGKPLTVTIRRDGETITLPTAKPRSTIDTVTHKAAVAVDVIDPVGLAAIGLKAGDEIGRVNGIDIDTADQFNGMITKNAGHSIIIAVERDSDTAVAKGILPTTIASSMPHLNQYEVGILNFNPDSANVHMSFKKSVENGWDMTMGLFRLIGQLVKSHQIQKAAGGVVAMASMTNVAVKDGPSYVLLLAAQISLSLAIFNILPIPILDGGHLLAFFIEWVRRGKKMPPQMQNAYMMFGLAIICVLVVLITGKDIWNLIRHNVPQ